MNYIDIVDHGADMGLVVRGKNREELFQHAAGGLFSLIVSGPRGVAKTVAKRFSYQSGDDALVEFLNDLLFWWDSARLVPAKVTAEEVSGTIHINVELYEFDSGCQHGQREVKAVTYHGFALTCEDAMLTARFVIDI